MNPGDVVQINPKSTEHGGAFMIVTHHKNGVVAGVVPAVNIGPLHGYDAVLLAEISVTFIGLAAHLPQTFVAFPSVIESGLRNSWGQAMDQALTGLAAAGVPVDKLQRLKPHLQKVVEAERVQVVTDPAWAPHMFHVQLKDGMATVRLSGTDDTGARALLEATKSIRDRHDKMVRLLSP